MSVDQTNVIDIISTDRITETVTLSITDHLSWDDSISHQRLLQEKLNYYLRFVESGELCEAYPTASGRPVAFKVVFKFAPDEAGRAFMNRVVSIVESAGYHLTIEVFTGASLN